MNEASIARPAVTRAPARRGATRGWWQRAPRLLIGLIVPAALLLLWQWLVEREVYSRGQLPAPGDVWAAVRQMDDADLLWLHVQISITRVAWGFAVGAGMPLVTDGTRL